MRCVSNAQGRSDTVNTSRLFFHRLLHIISLCTICHGEKGKPFTKTKIEQRKVNYHEINWLVWVGLYPHTRSMNI